MALNIFNSHSIGVPPWCPGNSPFFLSLNRNPLLLAEPNEPVSVDENDYIAARDINLNLDEGNVLTGNSKASTYEIKPRCRCRFSRSTVASKAGTAMLNDPTPATKMVKLCTALIRRRYVVIQLAITEVVDYLGDGIQLLNLYH
ncbi:hypothetical protein K438DRAFT_1747192 [Mycena galopus ATCC 62051]|nr:hypothetical protein K438DRAFT_1747192 [Mycena galopus ATCC 62051]